LISTTTKGKKREEGNGRTWEKERGPRVTVSEQGGRKKRKSQIFSTPNSRRERRGQQGQEESC